MQEASYEATILFHSCLGARNRGSCSGKLLMGAGGVCDLIVGHRPEHDALIYVVGKIPR